MVLLSLKNMLYILVFIYNALTIEGVGGEPALGQHVCQQVPLSEVGRNAVVAHHRNHTVQSLPGLQQALRYDYMGRCFFTTTTATGAGSFSQCKEALGNGSRVKEDARPIGHYAPPYFLAHIHYIPLLLITATRPCTRVITSPFVDANAVSLRTNYDLLNHLLLTVTAQRLQARTATTTSSTTITTSTCGSRSYSGWALGVLKIGQLNQQLRAVAKIRNITETFHK